MWRTDDYEASATTALVAGTETPAWRSGSALGAGWSSQTTQWPGLSSSGAPEGGEETQWRRATVSSPRSWKRIRLWSRTERGSVVSGVSSTMSGGRSVTDMGGGGLWLCVISGGDPGRRDGRGSRAGGLVRAWGGGAGPGTEFQGPRPGSDGGAHFHGSEIPDVGKAGFAPRTWTA